MSARLSSYQADPAAPDTLERRPIASCAILLLIAALTMCWPGFDIEPASARDRQSAASKSTAVSVSVDARDLLDDPQREQPWLDTCASLRDVAPAGCGGASRTWPGN
jgi:hypothetical protein